MNTDTQYVPTVLTSTPEIGTTVFVLERRDSGTWRHRPGTVTDVNPHVKAVKVRYATGPKTIVHKWHSLSQLTATAPAEGGK